MVWYNVVWTLVWYYKAWSGEVLYGVVSYGVVWLLYICWGKWEMFNAFSKATLSVICHAFIHYVFMSICGEPK